MPRINHHFDSLFYPRAIAVVGASRDPRAIGNKVFRALLDGGYRGILYPVNPAATEIHGWQAFPSVAALPAGIDLAVVVVPAAKVLGVIDECHARQIPSLVVISAGFGEVGERGRALQRELLVRARGYGMRLVGPNCFGIVNADPACPVNASFSPVFPLSGGVAMASQSGALGLSILGMSREFGLGLSKFVSMGNKIDVSSNDLLEYWERDPLTRVILLYLESFGNPRRFGGIARRVGKTKPIVALKSGRSAAGGRAAGSHTAALANNDAAVEALFHQSGVIRAESVEEMFDIAAALEWQPLPPGRRVAILTNAGGPAILCADTCEAEGLKVVELSAGLQAKLKSLFSPDASARNPVDMVASAGPDHYRRAIELVLRSGEVDALFVLHALLETALPPELPRAIADGVAAGRAGNAPRIPVFFCLMAPQAARQPLRLEGETIPVYSFPERPARALARIVRYAEWRAKPLPPAETAPKRDEAAARRLCDEFLNRHAEGWLPPDTTRELLALYGLPFPPGALAADAHAAELAAKRIGFPVALKLYSPTLTHKTEVGGVKLNLKTPDAVRAAFGEIEAALRRIGKREQMRGVWVQPMLGPGTELMLGMTRDPVFGPLIAFGLGGIHVEILSDVVFRVAPLTRADANEMVRGIRGAALLNGYRGHAPADIAALTDTLLALAQLADAVPEIAEIDLNPVFAYVPGQGCAIADARVRVRRDISTRR